MACTDYIDVVASADKKQLVWEQWEIIKRYKMEEIRAEQFELSKTLKNDMKRTTQNYFEVFKMEKYKGRK